MLAKRGRNETGPNRSAIELVDGLRAATGSAGELNRLASDLAELWSATAVALFVVPPGGLDLTTCRQAALLGVPARYSDRVLLPSALTVRLHEDPGPAGLSGDPFDPLGVARVFPSLRARLGSGMAFAVRSSRRPLAVLVVGFEGTGFPFPTLDQAASDLAWDLAPFFERRLLARELDGSEENYRLLMEGAVDAITVFDPAADRILDSNPAAESLFGMRSEVIANSPPVEILTYLRTTSLTNRDPGHPRDGLLQRPDGSMQPFEVRSRLVELRGRVLILSIFRDLRERRAAEEALRASEERYALAVAGANDGLWDWNVAAGRVHYSQRWKSMLGYGTEEIGDTPGEWLRRVHPEDLDRVRLGISDHFEGNTSCFEDEHRMRRKDGTFVWVLARGLAVRDHNGWAIRMAGSIADVTQRKAAEEKLLHAAFHDALTGLPNRALFMDRLAQLVRRSRRRPRARFAILFLDLDRFKVVNDSLGHTVGDELLVAMARRLERCIRPADTVARLGGDEFTILLDDIADIRAPSRVAERIHAELKREFRLVGQEVFTSVSIGIALGDSMTPDPETLIRNADLAMYRAKANGKARHEVFDKDMYAQAMALLELETDLRKGLERAEFRVHYQPLVSLKDGRVEGFEALVRWQHPERGLLAPGAFLEVAEETGLIVPLGRWVLGEACRQIRVWQEAGFGDLTVSVNIAGKQLQRAELVYEVRAALAATGLAPSDLTLEITENVVMDRGEESVRLLHSLKDLGVHLHMDDFGTGLSSLAYLRRFPLDTLKIDRSFVSNMDEDEEDAAIVQMIVTLARNLKLGVVAEGVETAEQLQSLKDLGCEIAQGYYFSRPLPAERAGLLLGHDAGASGPDPGTVPRCLASID